MPKLLIILDNRDKMAVLEVLKALISGLGKVKFLC